MKRIYHVTDGLQDHLVRANTRAQALGHVARNTLTVTLASQDDLVTLIQNGTPIEDAAAEPQEPEAHE